MLMPKVSVTEETCAAMFAGEYAGQKLCELVYPESPKRLRPTGVNLTPLCHRAWSFYASYHPAADVFAHFQFRIFDRAVIYVRGQKSEEREWWHDFEVFDATSRSTGGVKLSPIGEVAKPLHDFNGQLSHRSRVVLFPQQPSKGVVNVYHHSNGGFGIGTLASPLTEADGAEFREVRATFSFDSATQFIEAQRSAMARHRVLEAELAEQSGLVDVEG